MNCGGWSKDLAKGNTFLLTYATLKLDGPPARERTLSTVDHVYLFVRVRFLPALEPSRVPVGTLGGGQVGAQGF